MSDPELQIQESPTRLFGSFLLEKVRDNRDKHWLEIIEICGYGDCESLVLVDSEWRQSKREINEIYRYRVFYLNYISAAWRLLRNNFAEKIDDELNYEHCFGMGDSNLVLYPPNYEPNAESLNWIQYAFSRCLQEKDSYFLAPSFWDTLHGKNALILMELGGLRWRRMESGKKGLIFYTSRLKQHLVLHNASASELDYLSDVKGGSKPQSFALTCAPKRHLADVFHELFPELPNALLGKDLVKKYNHLLDQRASRESILYQCGFVDSTNPKAKGNFSAFNFALHHSRSKKPALFDEFGEEAKTNERIDTTSDALESSDDFADMPDWLQEEVHEDAAESAMPTERANIFKTPQAFDSKTNWRLLTKGDLLNAVLKYHEEKVSETSICIRCGYTTDKIGVFRRAFSKVANVEFGPLNKMLEKYYLSNHRTKPSIYATNSPLIEEKEAIRANTNTLKRSSTLRSQALEVHGSTCSVCGIKCEDILEVAHIIPVASGGADKPSNTLILCANHHSAFDKFLFAIDPQTREICFKRGVTASSLLITKTVLKANISAKALEIRKQMFDSASH